LSEASLETAPALVAGALPAPAIPGGPEDLTPAWLTAALRTRGALGGDAEVVRFATQTVGEGEGFIGTIVRITLEVSGPSTGAPRSVIGKFPTRVPENKAAGEILGAYDREIRFYREFSDGIPMRTPRLYYADMDPSGMEGREERLAEFFDRFPIWGIRLLTPLVRWLAGRSKRRYALLIEDLAPALAGDQLAGCSAEVSREVLRPLAHLHAAYWNRTSDESFSWVPRFELMRHWFQVTYRTNWPGFVAEYHDRLPRICGAAEWLESHAIAVVERLARSPYTLLHGDYRLDNMTIGNDDSGRAAPIIFDWQTPMRGPAGIEVAYFIGGNLDADVDRGAHQELLRFYRDELASHGVDYPLTELERDFQLGMLWEAWRMILGMEQLDFTNERGRALMETWMRRLDALLPEDPDRLLA
jgi:aminoglycoside phosphotransferase (APT) family kinase protein